MDKYSDSIKEIFNIKFVCKEDEGKYQVVFLWELKGNEYNVFSKKMCLYVLEGKVFKKNILQRED